MTETRSWVEHQEAIHRAHDENMEAHKELMKAFDDLECMIAALAAAVNRVANELEAKNGGV